MQVGSQFPNITNNVKKKMCGPCVSYKKIYWPFWRSTISSLKSLKWNLKNLTQCNINKDLAKMSQQICQLFGTGSIKAKEEWHIKFFSQKMCDLNQSSHLIVYMSNLL